MKTASELGLTELELAALIRVRGRLADGTIKFNLDTEDGPTFHMGLPLEFKECGTVGCIAGWIAFDLANADVVKSEVIVESLLDRVVDEADDGGEVAAYNLFYPYNEHASSWGEITPDHAVRAIDNFLLTGNPDWDAVLREDAE